MSEVTYEVVHGGGEPQDSHYVTDSFTDINEAIRFAGKCYAFQTLKKVVKDDITPAAKDLIRMVKEYEKTADAYNASLWEKK